MRVGRHLKTPSLFCDRVTDMLGVNSWRMITSVAPAIASLAAIAATGVFISNTPKDSDVVEADRKNTDNKVIVDEKLMAVRKATEAIAEAKKKGGTGPEVVKQLVELDDRLDKAMYDLFVVGAVTTSEIQSMVAAALKVRISMLSEDELSTQLTKDVDQLTKVVAAVAKRPANDPNTIVAAKYIRHIKSRYEGSTRLTEKHRSKWDALVALVPASAPPASALTSASASASRVTVDLLNPEKAAVKTDKTQATTANNNVSAFLAKAKNLDTKYTRATKRTEKLQVVKDAKANLQKLNTMSTTSIPAEYKAQYAEAKALLTKVGAYSP